jgi:DNA-binding NarL/FixJ family response regulator
MEKTGDTKKIRIVIVDDHTILVESLGAWIASHPAFELAGRAGDGESGLKLCLEVQPDVALVDIDLPKMDGINVVKRLLAEAPAVRILVLTGRMDPYAIWSVSDSGVHGYAEKTVSPEILEQAIQTVAGGGNFFSPLFQRVKREWLSQPEAFQKILSDREQVVLCRVAEGWDDERIARELGIAEPTVGFHRKAIRRKLELHNDRDLLNYARVWGLNKAIGAQGTPEPTN